MIGLNNALSLLRQSLFLFTTKGLFKLYSHVNAELLASMFYTTTMADKMPETNPVIAKFANDWPERLPDYTALAAFVESICKTEMRARNICCRFDVRAKPGGSIKDSIYKRQSARQRKESKRPGKSRNYKKGKQNGLRVSLRRRKRFLMSCIIS